MKPKVSLRFLLCSATLALLAAPSSQAITYYWDNNGDTAGFGTAAGTWAVPTTGDATQGWSTSNTGALLPAELTTTTADTVNFGTNTAGNGLAAGSITVSGTVETGNMIFGSQSGAITLSGGKISLDGGRTITSNNTGNIISSELALTGNSTVSLAFPGGGTPSSSSISFGVISGTGNMTFQNTAGQNPNPARFILNGASSYSGSTLLTSTSTNANIALSIGVNNALPTTTVLTLDGGNGTGSGRTANFELNGNSQTLAGLANTTVSLRTQNVLNSSETLSTLTINDSGNRTFSGRIGNGGTNIAIVKQGAGSWTLSGANTHTGLTTIDGGAVVVQNASALGATAAGTVVNGTNTSNAANARLELSGGVTVSGESLTISGTGNFFGALASTSGNNVWAGDVTIGAAGTRIGAVAGSSLKISGTIDSGIVNTGLIIRTTNLTGSVILSGANTYLGNTQVLIGKLQLADGDDRLPVGTTLQLSSGGTNPDAEFDLNGRNQEVAGLSIGGSANATQNSVNNSSATLSTLTVNTAAAPSTYDGILKGNLALTKDGADTLTLGGTNTYAGLTTVNGGTLALGATGTIDDSSGVHLGGGTFDLSAKSGYTVSNLTGTGNVVGAITVSTALAIGNSPGQISFGSDLTLGAASSYNYEFTGADTTADLGIVSGDLTLTTGATLNLFQLGTFTLGDTFTLFAYETGNLSGTFAGLAEGATATDNLGGLWQINYNETTAGANFGGDSSGLSFLNITAIPEPSAALIGSLGALLLLRRRRA